MKKLIKMNDKPILKSLRHIYFLNKYVDGMDFDMFQNDAKTIDACITKLTQLGEMVVRIDEEFKNDHNEIPWKGIKAFRNVVVHNYDSIKHDEVWETITENICELEKMYTDILINSFDYKYKDFKEELLDFTYLPYTKEMVENGLEKELEEDLVL